MTLLGRAKGADERAVVAQRLKRLSSITAKLRRFRDMKLSRMQDIGGCRAVVRTVARVRQLTTLYRRSSSKNPHDRPELVREYDYILEPKDDGYRSVHLVYRYRTASPHLTAYNGLRIEIQLRSQLQHAWATAVETVGTFTGQALKSNIGEESWLRFFALMGSAIARRERSPLVPGTPTQNDDLVTELRWLASRLKAHTVLQGLGYALSETTTREKDAKAYLLVLDPINKTLETTGFTHEELPRASEEYLAAEKKIAGTDSQAVLVSVESLKALRAAYPNYYLDTRAFLDAVRRATA